MKKKVCYRSGGKRGVGRLAIIAFLWLASPEAQVLASDAPVATNQAQGEAAFTLPTGVAAARPLDLAQVAQDPACWPKAVTLLQPIPFPVVFAGRVAGQTVVPTGSQLRLIRVAGVQVEVENLGARQLIAASVTDLLTRATRIRDAASPAQPPTSIYTARAREVAEEIQKDFWNPQTGLYAEKPGGKNPAVAWSGGVMFSALVGASRHDPDRYQPVLKKFFDGLDRYWDRKDAIPGYEPLPTNGSGNDKYYDDNEWLVITFLEAHALTGQTVYSQRAAETMKFVLSGWDESYLKGGIWWHQSHENKVRAKNTCSNAPAAVACLQLMKVSPPEEAQRLLATAEKISDWTAANLQLPNGLFADTRDIESDGMNHAQLTYNSALMVRAFLGLYRATGKPLFLERAQRIALAANSLLDRKDRGLPADPEKWAHLMVEADLALYRTTRQPYLLERASKQAQAYYDRWKTNGPVDLITVASISRVLWLMADMETEAGRSFWNKEDSSHPNLASPVRR